MTRDRFGRVVDILRISVTQECNMKCPYCHREGESAPRNTMDASEIKRIAESCARLGIKKVKITGGEPLMRKDITEIVRGVSSVEGIEEVSMTTNGMMLEGMAGALRDAGLSRINIGCDSLSSSVLQKTADKIRHCISALKDAGFGSIKLNMVVLAGINDCDIEDMIGFSRETGTTLQLIELIETKQNSEFYSRYFYSLSRVERGLRERASSFERRAVHGRMRYVVDGATVEVVRPHREEFCANCRTIRVTSDGRIKPCLMMDDNTVDAVSSIRAGVSDEGLDKLVLLSIDKREPYVNACRLG